MAVSHAAGDKSGNKMLYQFYFGSISSFSTYPVLTLVTDFAECHDDFGLKPPDGILREHTFTWLAFAQYIHVTTTLPHHSKAPRVVLVHKQFVLGTANDLLHLPKNYKLGNIVFGDYERDEEDCSLTISQLKLGVTCGRAYIEMPIADIIPHPEFTRFGVGNSLALVKLLRPIKSHYMVPVCLPTISERDRKKHQKVVYLIDYISTVPRDFESEKMAKMSIKLYTHKECRRHRMRSRLGSEGVTHVLCTSGCGVRPGAPIISHAAAGAFELIGLAAGGAPCSRRSMRRRLNVDPPVFIDIYPYFAWVINVITAHILPNPYPHTFILTDADPGENGLKMLRRREKHGWRARTYVSGNACFRRKQKKYIIFYDEKFQVNADPPAKINVFIRIFAGLDTQIKCVRVTLPNRQVSPVINGAGGYEINIRFNTEWFPYSFYFAVGLQGVNASVDLTAHWQMQKWEKKYGG
ncbi:uncharacterized protein LOC126375542 [Pectinophora gossypiella]|uniref:uncharacterized protein LOC126375542 n=1 Tax=Pectinophora gossypiella TaxID=13191 RepID=UPI00214E8FF9|nr:uncharacterized protein LOC126375542 [Pectinophora gossypiella]